MGSPFFAYLSKLRWVIRWGMKRNVIQENVMEHSWEVATIAHALALIHNRLYGGQVDAGAVAVAALYHDASEVITGDLPSPVKYHSEAIRQAYKSIEKQAEQELVALLPEALRADFGACMLDSLWSVQQRRLVKAADTLSAYVKCLAEVQAGNVEFSGAERDIARRLQDFDDMPEVGYFLKEFLPAYRLTLDELMLRRLE